MGEVARVARKSHRLEPAVEEVRRALVAAKRTQVTAADAAELSGLPLGLCDAALVELCARYPSRLSVLRGGALRVDFYSLSRARGPSVVGRALARLGRRLAHVRDAAMAIVTHLLLPELLALLTLNLVALGGATSTWPAVLRWPMLTLVAGIGFATFTGAFLGIVLFQFFPVLSLVLLGTAAMCVVMPFVMAPQTSWWGTLLAAALLIPLGIGCAGAPGWFLAKESWKMYVAFAGDEGVVRARAFWRAAGGLLFGPARTVDELTEERRAVALIRRQRGVVTDGDLMALFGWDRWRAGSEAARIVADYGGEVIVDDAGAVVYRFDPLLETAGPVAEVDVRPAWERAAPPAFFGCSGAIAFWTLFPIALAVAGLVAAPDRVLWPTPSTYPTGDDALTEGLGAWPYLPVVALLALRLPLWLARRLLHRWRVRFLDRLAEACGSPDGVTRPSLSRAELRALVSLGGEQVLDAGDVRRVRFPEMLRERAAAEALRKQVAHAPRAPVFTVDDRALEVRAAGGDAPASPVRAAKKKRKKRR